MMNYGYTEQEMLTHMGQVGTFSGAAQIFQVPNVPQNSFFPIPQNSFFNIPQSSFPVDREVNQTVAIDLSLKMPKKTSKSSKSTPKPRARRSAVPKQNERKRQNQRKKSKRNVKTEILGREIGMQTSCGKQMKKDTRPEILTTNIEGQEQPLQSKEVNNDENGNSIKEDNPLPLQNLTSAIKALSSMKRLENLEEIMNPNFIKGDLFMPEYKDLVKNIYSEQSADPPPKKKRRSRKQPKNDNAREEIKNLPESTAVSTAIFNSTPLFNTFNDVAPQQVPDMFVNQPSSVEPKSEKPTYRIPNAMSFLPKSNLELIKDIELINYYLPA